VNHRYSKEQDIFLVKALFAFSRSRQSTKVKSLLALVIISAALILGNPLYAFCYLRCFYYGLDTGRSNENSMIVFSVESRFFMKQKNPQTMRAVKTF